MTGNFWFEGKENRALVGNRESVRSVIENSGKVKAVFNGHTHWNRLDVHNGIPYFTITSIVENFKNDDVPTEGYAVVNIDSKQVEVKVFGNDPADMSYSFTNS